MTIASTTISSNGALSHSCLLSAKYQMPNNPAPYYHVGLLLASPNGASFQVQRGSNTSSAQFLLFQRWFQSQTEGVHGWITLDVGYTLDDVFNIFINNPFQGNHEFRGHKQGEWFETTWRPQAFRDFVQQEAPRTFFATHNEAVMATRFSDNNITNCLYFAVRLGQILGGPGNLFHSSVQTFR